MNLTNISPIGENIFISPTGEATLISKPQTNREGKLKMPIEGFSIMRVLDVCLVRKNINPIVSMINSWLESKFLSFKSQIYSDEQLDQEAKIKLAMSWHKAYKITTCYSKEIFGEDVLVTTRNIANKGELRSLEDAKCYNAYRTMLSEKIKNNDLASVIGYDKAFLPDSVQQDLLQTDFKPKSTNTKGVCLAASSSFAEKILNEPEISESILIKHAKDFQKGVPAKVAAKQDIVGDFWINSNRIECDKLTPSIRENICNRVLDIVCDRAERHGENIFENKILMNKIKDFTNKIILGMENYNSGLELQHRFTVDENWIVFVLYPYYVKNEEFRKSLIYLNKLVPIDQEVESLFKNIFKGFSLDLLVEEPNFDSKAHMYGLRINSEGTARARLVLGNYQNKKNSREHLKNFDDLEPGVYRNHFQTVAGHTVIYVKNKSGEGYIFDPIFGLIKCKKNEHALTYLKLLSMYPPPSEKEVYEDESRNYRVEIFRLAKQRF